MANLRGFVEIIMTYLLLFWEKKSMRALIKKNLVAHKNTNKLTSIIYALTLGCVIFLCVALNLVIKSTETIGVLGTGFPQYADLVVSGYILPNTRTDSVLTKYGPDIKNFGWVTQPLQYAYLEHFNFTTLSAPLLTLSGQTRSKFQASSSLAISPSSYFDETFDVAFVDNAESALGPSEILYTARGVQGMGLQQKDVEDLNLDQSSYESTFLFEDYRQVYGNRVYVERMLWNLAETPDFVKQASDYEDFAVNYISIPVYSRLANSTMDELVYTDLLITMDDPSDHRTIDNLCNEVK